MRLRATRVVVALVGIWSLAMIANTCLIATTCPVPVRVPRDAVWVELKYIPTNAAMDALSFYDRLSSLEFVIWALLAVSAIAVVTLIVERSWYYIRVSQQTRQFMSAANEALACARMPDIFWLATSYPMSPVATLVGAGLTRNESGEYQASTAAWHVAASAKTTEIARGLALLGTIAIAIPIIGSATVIAGLIQCLRGSAHVVMGSHVVQTWVADWLLCLLVALSISIVAICAHRLLAAKANRLLMEMERLSLAIIGRVTTASELTAGNHHCPVQTTREVKLLSTRPLTN